MFSFDIRIKVSIEDNFYKNFNYFFTMNDNMYVVLKVI